MQQHIILETKRLIIRNWQISDKNVFFQLNSNPVVMQFFPAKKSQAEAALIMAEQTKMIEQTGFGFYALELKENIPTNNSIKKATLVTSSLASPPLTVGPTVIGMCGLLKTNLAPFIPTNTVEIGWRLLPQYWGFGFVTEAASAILNYGFNTLKLPEIVSFAVQKNQRSINVMERLGMSHQKDKDFLHPRVPDSHQHLKRHVLYKKSNPYHSI